MKKNRFREFIRKFDWETLVGFTYPAEWDFQVLEDKILNNHLQREIVARYTFEWEGDTYAIERTAPGAKFASFN